MSSIGTICRCLCLTRSVLFLQKYSRWESNPRSSPCKGDVITPRPRKLVMFATKPRKFKLRKHIFYLSSVAIMKGVCFWVSHFVITDDRYDKEYTSQFCLDDNASTNCNYRWFAILGYSLTYSLTRNIRIYPKNSLILHASFFLSFFRLYHCLILSSLNLIHRIIHSFAFD